MAAVLPSMTFHQAIRAFVAEANVNSDLKQADDVAGLSTSDQLIAQAILQMGNSAPALAARRNLRIVSALYQRGSRGRKEDIIITLLNGVVDAGTEPGRKMKYIEWVNNRSIVAGSGRRGIDTTQDIEKDKMASAIDAAASLDMAAVAISLGAQYYETQDEGVKMKKILVLHEDGFKSIWHHHHNQGDSTGSSESGRGPIAAEEPASSLTIHKQIIDPSIAFFALGTTLNDHDLAAHFNGDDANAGLHPQALVPASAWNDIRGGGEVGAFVLPVHAVALDIDGGEGGYEAELMHDFGGQMYLGSTAMESDGSGGTASSGDPLGETCNIA